MWISEAGTIHRWFSGAYLMRSSGHILLSLLPMSTIEELLERKSRGSCLESREYHWRNPSLWPRDSLYRQKRKVGTKFADKDGRSLSRYSSLTDSGHGVCFYIDTAIWQPPRLLYRFAKSASLRICVQEWWVRISVRTAYVSWPRFPLTS
jgi:hypothetical protein